MTAAAIVGLTVSSYAIGWAIGWPPLVPVLNTLASYPFMVAAIRRRDLRLAFGRMIVWALTLGVCATLLSYAQPLRTDTLFIRGEPYRVEMFTWVLTGRGAESTPSLFIPQQLGHAALFSVLALASGSALAMPMGAVLMNYMGHYVGSLAAASRRPALTMILAWVPWAVIRVVSFVAIGVVLAAPLAGRLTRTETDWATGRRMLAWAAAGLVADIVLKALAAPAWQRMLVRVVGW